MDNRIDFKNFLFGESGIELETEDDAKVLLNVCRDNNISCDNIEPSDFKPEYCWYIRDGELLTTMFVSDMIDYVCEVWSFKDYCSNHC